jgi:hypothetical protein
LKLRRGTPGLFSFYNVLSLLGYVQQLLASYFCPFYGFDVINMS